MSREPWSTRSTSTPSSQRNIEDDVAADSERAKIGPQVVARLAQKGLGGQQEELLVEHVELTQRRAWVSVGDVLRDLVEVGISLAGGAGAAHFGLSFRWIRCSALSFS